MADDDLDILAWTMLGEAGGQGQGGMADIAHVVLNRLNTGKYGSSIQDVALAPKQFSTWNSGSGGNDPKGKYPKSSSEFQRARQIAEQVIAGQIPGPPGRPLDYNAPSIKPYWADSKSQHGTYERNGHVYYPSVPVPPGELPEVGTLQDTRRMPSPVTPVTATPDMAMMRRGAAPSQIIPDTFASLPKPSSANLGDNLAMSPVQGGAQQAPMFDAMYDTRLGAMTPSEPVNSQGIYTTRSKAPPPVPAQMSAQMSGRRATDPVLQAALDARYPSKPSPSLPSLYAGGGPTRPPTDQVGIAPTGRPMLDNGDGSVSTELSITVTDPRLNNGQPTNIPTIWGGRRLSDEQAINSARASGQTFTAFPSIEAAERAAEYRSANEILPRPQVSASDMARGRSGISTVASIPTTGVGQPPATRTVQSVPVLPRPQVSASDLARGRSGISTVASIPTVPQFSASDMARGRSTGAAVPDRLMPEYMAGAKAPAPPALPGPYSTATLSGEVNPMGQRVAVADAPMVPGAPYPFPRPTQFANAAPFPMPRPSFMPQVGTQLAVTPPRVAPVPFMRPNFGMGGPDIIPRRAPQPMPQVRAPLRITVNGANPVPQPRQQTSAVQQYRNSGLSPAAAYEMANRAAAERARDRSGNSTERSDYFKMATGG